MKLREWDKLLRKMPPETPVVFYRAGQKALEAGEYCDGLSVTASSFWEGDGWQPCVLVELGEGF